MDIGSLLNGNRKTYHLHSFQRPPFHRCYFFPNILRIRAAILSVTRETELLFC